MATIKSEIERILSAKEALALNLIANFGMPATNFYDLDGNIKSLNNWTLSATLGEDLYVSKEGDTMTGELTVEDIITAQAFYESSDKNLKHGISEISDIDKAKDIEFKEFYFNDSTSKKYGVIAQDIQSIGLDNLVGEKDGKLNVDYISLLCLKIAQLEHEIKNLKENGKILGNN